MPDKKYIRIATAERTSSPPDEALFRELAQVAKIPGAAREFFSSQIASAIEDAHEEQDVKQLKLFRTDQISPILDDVVRDARKLCDRLNMLTGSDIKITPHLVAGNFLRAEVMDNGLKVQTYISFLNDLEKAAKAASAEARTERGRPMGTVGHAAFDLFVRRLLLAAKDSGGKLTFYKSAHVPGGWDGKLLKAVKLLRSSLPKSFLPTKLASALDRIATRFRAHTRKNHR